MPRLAKLAINFIFLTGELEWGMGDFCIYTSARVKKETTSEIRGVKRRLRWRRDGTTVSCLYRQTEAFVYSTNDGSRVASLVTLFEHAVEERGDDADHCMTGLQTSKI